MHVAAFIGKPQHFKNLEPSYLSTCKWTICPFFQTRSHIVCVGPLAGKSGSANCLEVINIQSINHAINNQANHSKLILHADDAY